ncbi:MAG: hypothetical protein ACPGUV_00730 [Polyangiales bacterium]
MATAQRSGAWEALGIAWRTMGWQRGFKAVLICVLLCACRSSAAQTDAAKALEAFVSGMEQSMWDPQARRQAYDALCQHSQTQLRRRAHHANSLGAARLAPWQMLSRGGLHLDFRPERYRAELKAKRGRVWVIDAQDRRRAAVPVRQEGKRWCVALALAPPAAH